jgi:hypothetical protein
MRWAFHCNGNLAAGVVSYLLLLPCACRGPSKQATEQRERDHASALPPTASAGILTSDGVASVDCPKFADGQTRGALENAELTEASDLVPSTKNPGVLWSHNDSGAKARLFALTIDGRDLGSYHLERAALEDWEDMAIGPGPVAGKSYLYVGDIGANNRARKQISVYRVEEPVVELGQKPKKRRLEAVERFNFVYPDLASRDAESLMIDPREGDLYLVTKPHHGVPVVYRMKAPLDSGKTRTLEQVVALSTLGGGPLLPTLVTSGDISPDGSMILLRTYIHAYLWQRRDGEGVAAALQRPPCGVPLPVEPQGEAIAFAADGKGYYTVSEGRHALIHFFGRKD